MPSVSISLPPYLAQWCADVYESAVIAGVITIRPLKGSPLSQFLRVFLKRKPSNVSPPENSDNRNFKIKIEIPSFPGRDPSVYSYLSPVAEAQLRDLLRDSFDLDLFTDFSRFSNFTSQKSDFIYSWLDKHNIDPNEINWLAVSKRLQLIESRSRDCKRKKFSRSKSAD